MHTRVPMWWNPRLESDNGLVTLFWVFRLIFSNFPQIEHDFLAIVHYVHSSWNCRISRNLLYRWQRQTLSDVQNNREVYCKSRQMDRTENPTQLYSIFQQLLSLQKLNLCFWRHQWHGLDRSTGHNKRDDGDQMSTSEPLVSIFYPQIAVFKRLAGLLVPFRKPRGLTVWI